MDFDSGGWFLHLFVFCFFCFKKRAGFCGTQCLTKYVGEVLQGRAHCGSPWGGLLEMC